MPCPEWALTSYPCSSDYHAEQSGFRWKTTCKLNDWHPSSDTSHNRDCQLEMFCAIVLYSWKGLDRVLKASTAVGWKWMNTGLLLSTVVLQGLLGLCLYPVWFHPTSWSCIACCSRRHSNSAPSVDCTEESCFCPSRQFKDQAALLTFLACKLSRRNSVYLWVKELILQCCLQMWLIAKVSWMYKIKDAPLAFQNNREAAT